VQTFKFSTDPQLDAKIRDVVGLYRREQLAEVFLDNLRRWCAGQPVRNVVDKTVGYVR